jgi:F-box/TPR repeat protein Pof3
MLDLALARIKPDDEKRKTEIHSLKDEIVSARDALRQKLSRSKCHITNMPIELLYEIFFYAIANDYAMPIILSRVCRHWRGSSLGHPPLWRTLVLSSRNPEQKLGLWRERAKSKFSKVRILDVSRHQQKGLEDALAMCAPSSWHSLEVVSSSWAVNLNFLQKLHVAELDIRVPEQGIDAGIEMDAVAASKLQSLVLQGLSVFSPRYFAPAVNLKTFVYHPTALGDFSFPRTLLRGLLVGYPLLEHLSLNFQGFTLGPIENLELPNLQSLMLTQNFTAESILPQLLVPNLRTLHLTSISIQRLSSRLADILGQSRITDFRLRTCVLTDQDLVPLARNLSNVETVEISRSSVDINLFAYALLGPSPDPTSPTPPSPALHSVDFSHCFRLRGAAVRDLVKSRLPPPSTVSIESEDGTVTNDPHPVARIKSVIIDDCQSVEPEILPWLREKVATVSCIYQTKAEAKRKR